MDWKARIPAVVLWLALLFSSIEDGEAEQRIVCYYTNWSVYRPGTAKFSPQNINPYLCTHLIYAFGGFTKDNTLKPFDKYQDIEKGGYAKFTGLKTYNKNLKTMLAIGGWNEGSSRFSPMVADPGRRKEFVKNSVKFLRQNHFDGLDLDWEYPAFRDGGKPRDRNNYADLVQELREEFERESSKTGRPRLLLSMAVPAGIEYIDKGYDIPRLDDYLDFINLLSYDYHSAFEPAVNHHAPLYPLEEDNEYNYDSELTIDYSIKHLLKSGASSEKIVLGIPTYGRSYTLINEDATDMGSPADGPGEEGDATREKGYLAYYEICENIAKSDEWEVVQPNPSAMGPYAFRQNQWVGYDDEDIVRAKSRYVIENKLGGIMFWSIDNDDFRGKCHGRPYPLIEAAKEELLAGSERVTTRQKTKLSDNRKKNRIQGGQRVQGNTIGRKLTAGNRRATTQGAASRKRLSTTRPNSRSNTRGNSRADDSDEEVEDDEEEVNVVKAVERPRTRTRSKSRSKNRVASGGRRKSQQNSRHAEEKDDDSEKQESLSSSFTTPEPPTTPDPGSDFKCEDEGFFSHPRDCKKYFWCLDSGPGGLGIVGHQFTCPSGLVFNKAADSCDYPRNVVCPKKTSQSAVTTTRAPITAATARTTHLHKPTKRTTTAKPEVESEEYEYYDDEEEESEEVEEEPRTTTTYKPLQYKTINRSRPTTTTSAPSTTTTEAAIAASTKSYKTTPDRVASFEDEEDPRVLKELIELIKKAGGIEQLEKQLNYQEKNSGGSSDKNESQGKSTPATISRSLYERVLSRQATRIAGSFLGSLSTTQSPNGDRAEQRGTKNARTGFVNGPGGAQFEGLDNVPEVKSLRRTNKPKYVTIERHRSSTSEPPAEEEEEEDEEAADDDNTDVASSEDRAVSNPPQQRTTSRRVTPSYVNIRRSRPSTTTSENDVELKDEDSNDDLEDEEEEEEAVTQRHRVVNTEAESSGPKSRYTNVNRFRSTTSRNNEVDQLDEISERNEITTESTTTTTTTTTTEKIIPVTEEKTEAPIPTTTSEPSTPESFPASTLEPSSTESSAIPPITDSPVKLVEESATEILLTTAPASSSPGSSTESFARGGTTVSAVSQPRPFGFPRRGRPTTPAATSSAVTEQSRPKVDSETLRLPTLKELVGFSPAPTESVVDSTATFAPSTTKSVDTAIDGEKPRDERVDRPKNRLQDLIQDPLDEDNEADENDAREVDTSSEREIYDNDVLGSDEIQQRTFSSSFATAGTESARSTIHAGGINDTSRPIKLAEDPVKIGAEENQRSNFSSSFATVETENARSTIEAGGINDTNQPIKLAEDPVKIGAEENQRSNFSSSFATVETENARSTIEAGGINDTNQPIKRVEVPVKILDDTDGEEIAQLVLLRLPESKLSSAILRPVFRVKILEQDRQENREEAKQNDVPSGPISENIENSSENELNDNRNRFSRRRRVRINSLQASPTFAPSGGESEDRVGVRITSSSNFASPSKESEGRVGVRINSSPTFASPSRESDDQNGVRINSSPTSSTSASPSGESEDRVTERSRPRGRQRIVKARRRTRVNEAAVELKSEEPILNNRENERTDTVQGHKKLFGRREGADKLEDETTIPVAFTVEPSTTLKITTIRGNRPTSSKPSNVTRGFYITRSSDEAATTIADFVVTDSPIDSTDYPSSIGDELTRRTNFATRTRVTSAPRLEATLPAIEETSTRESDGTIFSKVEITTSEIESLENIRKLTSVDYETSSDFSTVDDGIAESFNAMIVPTTEELEAAKISESSVTTFRPFVSRKPVNNPTISADSINDPTIPADSINDPTIPAESIDSTTEGIDKFMVTNVDDFTGMFGETLKTSENSNYGSSRNLDARSSTVPITTVEDNDESQTEIPVTSQTEIPTRRTTNVVENTTTYTGPIKRGRVRFTAPEKPGLRPESTHPRRGTTSTESDVADINSTTIAPNVDEIDVPSYPSRLRGRGRQRNATKSVRTDESKAPTASTSRNVQHKSTTEANRLVTNSAETTRNLYSSRFSFRNFERGQKTTQFDDDVRINSVTPVEFTASSSASTETYDRIAESEVATEINDLSATSPKSTTFPDTPRSSSGNPEQIQRTTKYFEAGDVRINSVTPPEFTSINDVSTEVYDKTGEPVMTTEATATTSFVEITARSRSRSSLASQDETRGTTTSIEIDDTAKTSTNSPVDAVTLGYDKKVDSSTTLEDEETTETHLQTSKRNDDPQTTIESNDFSASTTPKISTSAITTESPDATVTLNSVAVDRYSSSNSVEITGVQSRLTTSMSTDSVVVPMTTEIYEKTSDSSEPTSTIDFVTTQEETSLAKSTNGVEATFTLKETTIPWAYNRRYNRRNNTKIVEDPKTQTLNTSRDVAATETIAPTTEFYVSDRTASAMETGAADARTTEREEKSTEAIQTVWHSTTIPQAENYNITEATEEPNFATTLGNTMIDTLKESTIPADKHTEDTKSTTISAATTSGTKSDHDLNASRRTENYRNIYSTTESSNESINPEVTRTTENYDKKSYSTVESSHNSGTPDVTRRTTENYDKSSYFTVESSYNSVTPDVTERTTGNYKKKSYSTVESSYNSITPDVPRRTTENYNKNFYSTLESSYNSIAPDVPRRTTENYNKNVYSTLESSYNSIVPDVPRRTTENYSKNVYSTLESSYNSIAPDVPRRTTENYAKTVYSSSESSYNPITPSAPREIKRTRGRVRFTNFAANPDESGGSRRPVKQVVVRRRPASTTNQQQIHDSTTPKSRKQIPNERKKINSSPEEIAKKENDVRIVDNKLATEKRRNSTASTRRRVVVYRGRPRAESVTNPPTTTTTTTVQSSSLSINDVSGDSGRTRRRKWRKRLVAKRAKADDLDDQSIAESGHFHRAVIDDLVDEQSLGSGVSELGDESLKSQDVADGEVNIYKSSGGFLRRPGTLIRPEGSSRPRTPAPGTLVVGTIRTSGPPAPFSKIRPVENVKNDDQSSRAQELAVTLADPPEGPTSSSGRLPFRATTRKISTTIAPRTEASVTLRTTPVSRRRQKPRGGDRTVEVVTARPRRPAIIDYDYYVDDEVRLVVKPELKDKLFVTGKGGIRCLDQGNFAHPTSCKKFITCARMVNGQVLGTEYTCPDKLSFDPVGGICNWSAGLGCEDNSNP